MKTRPLIILAVVVVAIVGTAIWFLQSPPTTPPSLPTVATKPVQATPVPMPVSPVRTETTPTATAAVPKPEVTKPTPEPMAEWEMKIDQALRANVGETETAQILINMMPTLPPEGQAVAAQHIANLIQDKDFNRVMPLLRNTALPEEVHDILVTDLMNRDDAVKLPALLEVAKMPNHPHHEEAQTDLQIFLDEDYGTNWQQWDKAVKDYLKAQADEDAAVNNPPVKQ
jgi:hypothetical protein